MCRCSVPVVDAKDEDKSQTSPAKKRTRRACIVEEKNTGKSEALRRLEEEKNDDTAVAPQPKKKKKSGPVVQEKEKQTSVPNDCTTVEPKAKKRTSRGPTLLTKVVIARANGVVKPITYNDLGQSIGDTNSEMQSYVGVVVRSTVPIEIENWRSVSTELKEKVWDQIKVKPCSDSI